MAEFETGNIAPQVAQDTQPDPPSKALYNALVSTNKYNLPNYDQFSADMKDVNKRKKLLETVKNEGLYGKNRTLNDFNAHFFTDIDVKKKEATPSVSPVSSPVVAQPTKPSSTTPTENPVEALKTTGAFGMTPDNTTLPVNLPRIETNDKLEKERKQIEADAAALSMGVPFKGQESNDFSPRAAASEIAYRKEVLAKKQFNAVGLEQTTKERYKKGEVVKNNNPADWNFINQNFTALDDKTKTAIAQHLDDLKLENPQRYKDVVNRIYVGETSGEPVFDQSTGATLINPSTPIDLRMSPKEQVSFAQEAIAKRINEKKTDLVIYKSRKTQGKGVVDAEHALSQADDIEKLTKDYNKTVELDPEGTAENIQRKREKALNARKAKGEFGIMNQIEAQTTQSINGAVNVINEAAVSIINMANDMRKGSDHTYDYLDKTFDKFAEAADKIKGDDASDQKLSTSNVIPKTVKQIANMAQLFAGAELYGGGKIGLTLAGMTTQYRQYKEEGLQKGLSDETAMKFAFTQSFIQGALENISPNFGALAAKGGKSAIMGLLRSNPLATTKELVKHGFKQVVKENAQEFMQLASDKAVNALTNQAIGQDKFDTRITADEALETFVLTTLATGAVTGATARAQLKGAQREQLNQLLENPEETAAQIDELVTEGQLTAEQGEEVKKGLNEAVKESKKKDDEPTTTEAAQVEPVAAQPDEVKDKTEEEKKARLARIDAMQLPPMPTTEAAAPENKVQEIDLENATKEDLLNETNQAPAEATTTEEEKKRQSVANTTTTEQSEPSRQSEAEPIVAETNNGESIAEPETPEQRKERVNRTILDAKVQKNTEKAIKGVLDNTKDAKLLDVLPKAEKAKAQKVISDIYAEDKKNAPKVEPQPEAPKTEAKKPKSALQKGQAVGSNNKNVKEFEPTNIKEEIEKHLAEGGKINEKDFQDYFGDGKGGTQAEMTKWKGSIDANAPSIDQLSEGFQFKEGAHATDVKNAFQEILQENGSAADVRKNVESKHKDRKAQLEGKNNPYESADYEQAMKDLESKENKVKDDDIKAYNEFAYNTHELDTQAASDKAVAEKHAKSLERVLNDPQYQKEDGSFDYDKLNENIQNGFEPDIIEYLSQAEQLGIKTNEANEQIKSAANNRSTTEGGNEKQDSKKESERGRDNGNTDTRSEREQGNGEKGGNERGQVEDKKKFTQASRGSRAAFVQKGIVDVLNQVKKSFPNVEVISDQTEIDAIKAANPELAGDRGFVYEGKVYIDLALADPTTPLHEFAHVWVDLLEKVNTPQFEQAKKLIEGTVYHTQAKTENPTKSANDLAKEAMVRAIEADAVRALNEGKVKQAVTKVKDWLRKFFNIPPTFNVSKMTLEDFVRQANRELLRGTPLTQSSSLDIDNLLKNKSSNEFVVSNSVMSKRNLDGRAAKFVAYFREFMLLKGTKLGVPFQNRIRNAEAKEKAKVARYADLLRRWKIDLLSDARELSEADAADLMTREAEVFNGTRVIADLPPHRQKNMENLIQARKEIQRAFLDNMEVQGQVVINHDLNPLLTANYELQQNADNRLDEINKEYDALFEKVKSMTDPAAIKAELDNIQRKSQALKLQILSDKLREVKGALTLIKDKAADLPAQQQAFLNEIRDLQDSIEKIQKNGSAVLPSPTAYTDIIKRTQKAIKNQEKLNENVSEKAKQANNFPILEAEVQRLKDELELLLESNTAGDFKTKVLKEIDATRNLERKAELNKVKQKDTVEIRFKKKADGTFDMTFYQRDGTKVDAKDVTERDLRNMLGLVDSNIDKMIDNTEGYLPISNPQVLLNNPLYEKVRKNDNYTRRSYMKHHETLNAQNIKEKIGQQAYDEGVKAIRKMYETAEMTAIRIKNTEGGDKVYTFLNESGVESAEMSIDDLKKFLQNIDVSAAQIRAIETHIAEGKLDWFKFNGTKGRYAEHGVTFTLSKDQENQILNDFLANENAPLEGGVSSKKGLDTTMLKKRQNISPELRGLMGEYTDPIVVATRTIMDAAITQQKDKYHQMLLSEGMGTLFLTEPNERTGHTVKLSKNEMGTLEKIYDEKGNAISVLYTTEELYDGLLGSTAETAKMLKIWGLSNISGYAKMFLTVLGADTRTRDKLSNFFRLLEMGNIGQVQNYFEATRVANADMDKIDIKKSDFKNKRVGHIAKEIITKGIPQSFNIIDSIFRGVEAFNSKQYGNVENPHIEALLQEAREFDLVDGDITVQDIMQGSTVMEGNSWVKQGLREAGKTYQKADAATKVLFYWGEKQKMLSRGLTEEQAKEAAAANVRLLVPDYSITPKIAKILAVTPVVGNFIMYKTESFRTYTNGWKLAVSEVVEGLKSNNKAQVRQGAGRVASLSAAVGVRAALYKGIAHLVMSALGSAFDWDDDKDTEALRKLQPSYAKNSQFIVYGKKGNIINAIDFSFTDPEGDISKMAIAAMRGGSTYDKFVGVSKEFFQGYTDADIALKSIINVMVNQDAYGGKIRNTEDNIIGQGGQDVADYLWSIYTPKFITSASKVYNAALLDVLSDAQKPSGGVNTPTVGNEIGNILLGVKTKKIDLDAMYKRAMQADDARIEEAQRKFEGFDKTISDVAKTYDYTKMIFTGQTQNDKLKDKRETSVDLVKDVFNDMLPKYEAAKQLGIDPAAPIRNKQLKSQLSTGQFTDPMFKSRSEERIKK